MAVPKEYKLLGFNLEAFLNYKGQQYADIIASTVDEIKIYDNKLSINDFNVVVNDSKLNLNSEMDLKNIKLNAKSDKFILKDIFDIINSNFIVPNGSELLKPLKNPSGRVAFDVQYLNGDLSGKLNINNAKAELKDLSLIPLNIEKGLHSMVQRIDETAPLYYVNEGTYFSSLILAVYEDDIPNRLEQNRLLYSTIKYFNNNAQVYLHVLDGGHCRASSEVDKDGEYTLVKLMKAWRKML